LDGLRLLWLLLLLLLVLLYVKRFLLFALIVLSAAVEEEEGCCEEKEEAPPPGEGEARDEASGPKDTKEPLRLFAQNGGRWFLLPYESANS